MAVEKYSSTVQHRLDMLVRSAPQTRYPLLALIFVQTTGTVPFAVIVMVSSMLLWGEYLSQSLQNGAVSTIPIFSGEPRKDRWESTT